MPPSGGGKLDEKGGYTVLAFAHVRAQPGHAQRVHGPEHVPPVVRVLPDVDEVRS